MTTLQLAEVTLRRGNRAVLDCVSLELRPGDLIALVGPNGAGKSSLLRCALGLDRPAAGEVRLGGELVSRLPARERAARLAWLPQRAVLSEPLSALELVSAARFRFAESHAQSRRAARHALDRVGAAPLERRSVLTLSGGERQRVAFAAALAQEAPLILLDEPASHLDPSQGYELCRLIGDLWHSGHGVLCVTHDLAWLGAISGSGALQVHGLRAGRSAFQCRFSDRRLAAHLGELFGVRVDLVAGDGQRWLLVRPSMPGGAAR